ncbi:hypothetical protein QLH62_11430 [Streptococcus iniae]|nr:hypothetical protein QLH62_11430 [Streptococcus iniae]
MEKEQVKQIYFTIKQEAEIRGYEVQVSNKSVMQSLNTNFFNFYDFGLEVVLPLLTGDAVILKLRDAVTENRFKFRELFAEHKNKVIEINASNRYTTRAKRELSIEVRQSFVNQMSRLESKFNKQKKELDTKTGKLISQYVLELKETYGNVPDLINNINRSFNGSIEVYNTNKIADDIYILREEPTGYKDITENMGEMFDRIARIHKQDTRYFISQLKEDARNSNLSEEQYMVKVKRQHFSVQHL